MDPVHASVSVPQRPARAEVEAALRTRAAGTYADFLLPYLRPEMTVLDCGCGTATIALGLAEAVPGGHVVGADLAPQSLATGRGYRDVLGRENFTCTVADARQLPFRDETFDAVLCHSVLETLRDPENAVSELRRVVRPQGIVAAASVEYSGIIFGGKNTDSPRRFYEIRQQMWRAMAIAEPNTGGRLRGLFVEVGFRRVGVSAAYVSYGTAERIRGFAQDRAAECRDREFQADVIRAGIASADELARLATAWDEWSEDPSAFFAFPWCRVLAWR